MVITLAFGGVIAVYGSAAAIGTRPCQTPSSTLLAASVRVSWHSAIAGHQHQAQKSPNLLPTQQTWTQYFSSRADQPESLGQLWLRKIINHEWVGTSIQQHTFQTQRPRNSSAAHRQC